MTLPKPHQRSVGAEIQSIRRSLAAVVRALARVGPALEAGARAAARGAARPRRKLHLSPARRAQLALQGQYIGHMRMLPARQQAAVKALRVRKGIKPAIALAKRLGQS
jgi:hypothetical protein